MNKIERHSKIEKNKLRSMKEAISDCVSDGCSINIEGFTHLICFAAGHEIIRQGKKNLWGIRLTPDLVYDQMIEAGCFKKLTFSWAGNPGVGSLHALRRAIEKNTAPTLQLDEYSHFGLMSRLQAGSMGLPFMPLYNYKGTDIAKNNSEIKSIVCPYTGDQLATVPALHPDVTIVHCQRADAQGNAQVWGLLGTQKEAAFSAKKVIVVTEEIVSSEIIRADPNRTLIPGIIVDHVVHEPWGCHPSYTQGFYDRDNDFYVHFDSISKDKSTYQDYLNEFVLKCKDRKTYISKLGGPLLEKLKASSLKCEGVDYGY